MSKIRYDEDHEGNWSRIDYGIQCNNILLFSFFKCQAIDGHEGECWCYDSNGDLIISSVKKGLSIIPPDSDRYIHSKDMRNKNYYCNYTTKTEVKDPIVIDRLNRGEKETQNEEIMKFRPIDAETLKQHHKKVKELREKGYLA